MALTLGIVILTVFPFFLLESDHCNLLVNSEYECMYGAYGLCRFLGIVENGPADTHPNPKPDIFQVRRRGGWLHIS